MLVGHNPAIRELAIELIADAGEEVVGKFPTGALATLTFSGPWHTLGPRGTELITFLKPRDPD